MGFEKCIEQITKAAGRRLTDDELTDIVGRVQSEVTRLAREQGLASAKAGMPQVDSLPPGLIKQAAEKATAELVHAKMKERQRIALTIAAHDRVKAQVEAAPNVARGLASVLDRIDGRTRAINNQYVGQLVETLTATSPKFFGLIEDMRGLRALVKELFGEDSGSPTAKAGAAAWAKVAEDMRVRFNQAGGDVGKIENWGMPQGHDMRLVRAAGEDAWVSYITPRLDRAKYLRDDGASMTDIEVDAAVRAAYQTISTDGLNKIKPGRVTGTGMRAKRHAEHRMLHFNGADAWWEYHQQFGGRGIYQTMVGHVGNLARDIALTETLGPNPGRQFQFWHDTARKAGHAGARLTFLQSYYDQLDGSANQIADARFAEAAQGLRNLQVSAKLGGAVLSSVTDFATSAVTVGFNRLPFMRYARNVLRSLNPLNDADVRLAQRAGLGLDTLIGELNRWGEDSFGRGWTGRLSSATMRASGMNKLTEANRRAFGVTMMATLGDLSKVEWGKLHARDLAQLEHYGFTADDWALLAKATAEDWGGGNGQVLTPASIMRLTDAELGAVDAQAVKLRNGLATKVLDMVLSETNYAVVTPGARERALMVGGSLKKGTLAGEFARTAWLFKSFPVAVISKHWMRGWDLPTAGGRAAYLASFAVGTTVLGAVAMQLKDIAKGKEPRDMDSPAFWAAAFAQGGGAGIFGDYLFSDQSRFGRSITETALGPVFGGVAPDLYDLTLGNLHQAARGEDAHAGAEALRFVQGNTPLVNLWYTRAALDHLVFHQLQEYVSPGYLRNMKKRVREDTGQDFWWQPGALMPGQ